MSTPVLDVHIDRKEFSGKPVLGNVRLVLQKGERLAILGPSGIGKTTLLRLIAGLDTLFDGTIARPQRIAMVFQEPVLLPWRNAIDNLRITTGADGVEAKRNLAAVGLAGRGSEYPHRFSLGQQRRLSLARALAADPDLIILDEPFASLDEATADQMISLTHELVSARNMSMLFVTHSRTEADRLAGRILKLDGSPATLSQA